MFRIKFKFLRIIAFVCTPLLYIPLAACTADNVPESTQVPLSTQPPHPDLLGVWDVHYETSAHLNYAVRLEIIIKPDGAVNGIERNSAHKAILLPAAQFTGEVNGRHVKFSWKTKTQFEYSDKAEYDLFFKGKLPTANEGISELHGTLMGTEFGAGSCDIIITEANGPRFERKPISDCPRIAVTGTWNVMRSKW